MSEDEFIIHTRRLRYQSPIPSSSSLSLSDYEDDASNTRLHETANIFDAKNNLDTDESIINLYKPSTTACETRVHFNYYQNDDSSDSGDSEISWPTTEIPDAWGAYPLCTKPWTDEDKLVASFKTFRIEYVEQEVNGMLTDRILALASSYLDRCPVTGNYVLCKCNLKKQNLRDITIMSYHYYLQYVDLSHNELTNIDALGQLPFLMYLDVSHNRMTELLPFKAPFNLSYVDYSFNECVYLKDITDFWSIVYLDLSYNKIQKINGLQNLKYLRHLNLEYNSIERLENLSHMNLLTLTLNNNLITSFEEGEDVGLQTLTSLIKLHLSHNQLTSLKLFENVNTLETVTIVANLISDISELYHLKSLLSLTELDLRQNCLSSLPHYYDFCIFNLPSLLYLDGNFVDPQSKVHAVAKFSVLSNTYIPMKLTSILTLVHQMNHPSISPYDLRIDEQLPKIVILVGPPASNKGNFIRELYNLEKQHLKIGVSHTTRQMIEGEQDGLTYHYVSQSEFIHLIHIGEMLTCKKFLGHYYGITRSELHKVSGTKKILIFHCDLVNAIHLKNIGLSPYLILTIPGELDMHRRFTMEKYFIQNTERDALSIKIVRGKRFEKEDGLLSTEHIDYDYNYQLKRASSRESVGSESASVLFTQFIDETDLNLLEGATYSRYQRTQSKISATSTENMSPSLDSKEWEKIVMKEKPEKQAVSFGEVLQVDEAHVSSSTSTASVPLGEESHYSATILDDDIFIPYEEFNTENLSTFHYSIVTCRVQYIKYVNDNSGLFLNSLFTDEHLKSIKKALVIMKDIFLEKVPEYERYNVNDDPCYEEFLGQRLNDFKAEMTKPCYDRM